jgi:signal transduction histidine kinase
LTGSGIGGACSGRGNIGPVEAAALLSIRAAPGPRRLVFVGVAFLIALLLVMNAALIIDLRKRDLRVEESQLASASLTLAEQADRSFQSVDLVLSSVADFMENQGIVDEASLKRDMASRDVHRLLKDKIGSIPQLSALTVIDGDGKLVNFSRYWPVPVVSAADRDYFRALKANPNLKTFISAPVQNRGNGAWTIFLARRISGQHGEFIGVLLGAMELRYFEDFYRSVSEGNQGSIVLLRRDGVTLVRYPLAAAVGKSFGAEHILQGGTAGTVREISPIDGQMRLKAAHALANYPLFTLVTKTEAAALSNWWSVARLISLATVIAALSLAVGAFLLGRHLNHQSELAHAQAQIADAERARSLAEAEVQRQKEVTNAFDAMRVAKEEAETADRAKSEFLANMSHELRTPLNAIIGFSDMMISEAMGPLPNQHYRGYVKDIHASGTHLLSIISDILDLSKASAGKLELTESWFDAREAVNSACRLMRQRIDGAGLSLIITLPPDAVSIYADERKLKQMLLNLLSNAYRFTPEGGRIECRLDLEEEGIIFSVSDTGIGIAAEHLDRVLKPFVQIEPSYRRMHEGTGLGLALVKAMAELHGGDLRLESTPGAGTSAFVFLPLTRLKSESATAAAE